MMSLSVQIFTVPSISIYLIENHDAVTQMMQGFIGLLTESTDEDDKLELNWLDEEKSEFQRMLTSIKVQGISGKWIGAFMLECRIIF